MNVEIINIGNEILIGQVLNTNASWMADHLSLAGFKVTHIVVIPDNKEAIFDALNYAVKRSTVVLMTGGLGPTKDDITKHTLCDYFSTSLVFNQKAFDQIKLFFTLRKMEVSELNRKQAEIPENCIPLQNTEGTAPGMLFDLNGKIIISMPGVPHEMKVLMKEQVIPLLSNKFECKGLLKKTILTQGIGESQLTEILAEWEDHLPSNFKLAYLPQPGLVRLRLTAEGEKTEKLQKDFDQQIEQLQFLIPNLIFGYDEEQLEEIVGKMLTDKKLSVSTAESCTGGYIAHLLTSISGSSAYFKGSVVAYANEIKEQFLGVNHQTLITHGAVSEQVVIEMALSIQKLYNTDYAIATSGIAGPTGGSDKKPVGITWIALALPNKSVITKKYFFGEHRGRNIRKTALTALNQLRIQLIKKKIFNYIIF